MAESIFSAIQRQALITDSVIVSYSGGKDSAVVLDLCSRHFKTVHAFFMFQVEGLSFQESVLRWAEAKYGLEIYRIPHFGLSRQYRSGGYTKFDGSIPVVTVKDVYTHVRGVFDTHWIAAGERAKDSIVRNAMIKKSGSIDEGRGRFFPLAYWSKEQVTKYLAQRQIKVSPESALLGHSFRDIDGDDILKIREHYPEDYERILQAFPLVGAAVFRAQTYGNQGKKGRRAARANAAPEVSPQAGGTLDPGRTPQESTPHH